ncbi:MAG: haloacid dehalogenase [Armatimonadota bacterium]
MLEGIEETAEEIRKELNALHEARETAYSKSRDIVRSSSISIKSVHREEFDRARDALEETREMVQEMHTALADAPGLSYGGFVADSEKEYAEAAITLACVTGETIPTHDDLNIPGAAWLNGLAEVVGEFRRHVLDMIRTNNLDRAEKFLGAMDDIYQVIMSFDYPDAIALGLRRRSDAARGMVERSRGDLTNALRQASLEKRLKELEESLQQETEE